MVLPIIIGIAVIALLFTFRDQIKAFADQSLKEPTTEEVEQQTKIDERGAVQNTQAFLLGEKGLADLQASSEANKIAIAKFISDAQKNIDIGVMGVSQTLVQAEKNLSTFAKESQETIVSSVSQFQKDVDKNISGIGASIFQFGVDTRTNLENIFGGQTMPKAIATTVSPTPILTTKQGTAIPDLSFLTPVETLEGQGSKVDQEKAELVVKSDRFTSSRFGSR